MSSQKRNTHDSKSQIRNPNYEIRILKKLSAAPVSTNPPRERARTTKNNAITTKIPCNLQKLFTEGQPRAMVGTIRRKRHCMKGGREWSFGGRDRRSHHTPRAHSHFPRHLRLGLCSRIWERTPFEFWGGNVRNWWRWSCSHVGTYTVRWD